MITNESSGHGKEDLRLWRKGMVFGDVFGYGVDQQGA
jgi:hypothetical protein